MAVRKRPNREALQAEYDRQPSIGATAEVFGVSYLTMCRWMRDLDVVARPASGASVLPDRRRGGRRYKRTRKLPQHVTLEQARRIRELRVEHPEWTARECAETAGATCSMQMVYLVLRGKRVMDPEAVPPGWSPPGVQPKASARLSFGRVKR